MSFKKVAFFQVRPFRSLIFATCNKKFRQPLEKVQQFSNLQKPLQEVAKGLVSKFKRWGYFEVLIMNIMHTEIFVEGKLVFTWNLYLKMRKVQSTKIKYMNFLIMQWQV